MREESGFNVKYFTKKIKKGGGLFSEILTMTIFFPPKVNHWLLHGFYTKDNLWSNNSQEKIKVNTSNSHDLSPKKGLERNFTQITCNTH